MRVRPRQRWPPRIRRRLIAFSGPETPHIDSIQNEPTMNSNDRPDDASNGVESNRSDNHDDNGAPMSDTTPSTPTDRAPGTATSAVTRDAARLRSVMSDMRREGPVVG